MRRFNITSEMVKGFAAEIEKNIEKINSKNGFAIANFRATAKGGKVTEFPDGEKRISITVSMLSPYTVCLGTGAKKRRMDIFFNADMKIISSCGNILNYIAGQLESLNHSVEYVKEWGVDSITEQVYPDLADTIEKYGFEWFEKKFAEFQQYLDSLVETKEEENDMENIVDMFKGYIMDVLVEDFKNAVESAEVFANEYGDNFEESMHLCSDFKYDYDIEIMWADWCWENDIMSRDAAYKYYDANRDMFINEDDLEEIVDGFEDTYGVGIEDNCWGSCLIWVFNPYYVSEEEVKNDSPCLERVVDTIKGYVDNYEGLLMNYDGNSASICVPWDVFNEDDMKMLIEDDGFEGCVVGALMGRDIKDVLVYDDGVYVSVNAEKFDKVA